MDTDMEVSSCRRPDPSGWTTNSELPCRPEPVVSGAYMSNTIQRPSGETWALAVHVVPLAGTAEPTGTACTEVPSTFATKTRPSGSASGPVTAAKVTCRESGKKFPGRAHQNRTRVPVGFRRTGSPPDVGTT